MSIDDQSAPLPMRDGVVYDHRYRTKVALQRMKSGRVKQGKIARPPGPDGRKIMLDNLRGHRPVAEAFFEMPREYPRLAYLRMLTENTYVLTHPETITVAFHTHGKDTVKSRALQVTRPVLGDGLLTSEGEHHLRQRRLIQPAFHKQRIARYAEQMVELSQAHQRGWSDGKIIDVVPDMSALTLAVVGRALFGSDLSGDAGDVGRSLEEVLSRFQRRLLPGALKMAQWPLPWNKPVNRANDQLDALVQRLIAEHRAGQGDPDDLLNMMIAAQEDGFAMDDAQLRDEATTLVLAGHETTAMLLSWTWLSLANNPQVEATLHAELDAVIGAEPLTMADMARLPYTQAVIAESLRQHPPAWVISRRLLTDIEIDGWAVPKGSTVMASDYAMHNDPRFWSQPSHFRPERWLTDEGKYSESAPGVPRGAWFPFGFGNRRCIGDQFALVEATLLLADLARRWKLEQVPGNRVIPRAAVTLRPGGVYRMKLVAR